MLIGAMGPEFGTSHNDDVLIRLRGVTKTYDEGGSRRDVVLDANACVARGEIVALLGPSGSGKSTLLNLISGIDLPSRGEVWVDSRDLARLSERQRTLFRRSQIGFVFQFFNLISTLTVEENLLLPLELNGRGGSAGRRRTAEVLESVGLADRKRDFPDKLSGGEQQRVAVARALVHDPPLVLADEPTGNLDAETGRRVIELLQKLVRVGGKTMVIVSHSADAAAIADRALTIHDGRLVESQRRQER